MSDTSIYKTFLKSIETRIGYSVKLNKGNNWRKVQRKENRT